QIGNFRNAELHSGGELVAGDAGGQLAIPWKQAEVLLVEPIQELASRTLFSLADARGRLQIRHRFLRVEGSALEDCRQEAGAPVVDAGLWDPARVGDGHIG